MPCQQTIQLSQFFGQHTVVVHSRRLGPVEAAQLQHTVEQLIERGIRRVWMDCQLLESLTYYGQQAILTVLQRASSAHLSLLWYGFSQRVKQELAASGLYLLLQNIPLSSYRDL